MRGQGFRQPGSAWKPFEYAAGFDAKKITPGTLLLDVTSEFEPNGVPRDADLKERGPVLARDALYYSLNDTAVRMLDKVGVDTVDSLAQKVHLTYPRSPRQISAGWPRRRHRYGRGRTCSSTRPPSR